MKIFWSNKYFDLLIKGTQEQVFHFTPTLHNFPKQQILKIKSWQHHATNYFGTGCDSQTLARSAGSRYILSWCNGGSCSGLNITIGNVHNHIIYIHIRVCAQEVSVQLWKNIQILVSPLYKNLDILHKCMKSCNRFYGVSIYKACSHLEDFWIFESSSHKVIVNS